MAEDDRALSYAAKLASVNQLCKIEYNGELMIYSRVECRGSNMQYNMQLHSAVDNISEKTY